MGETPPAFGPILSNKERKNRKRQKTKGKGEKSEDKRIKGGRKILRLIYLFSSCM